MIVLTTGCSPIGLLNSLTPSDTYRGIPDLSFGTHDRQKLDVYVPMLPDRTSASPVVLFFYGGNWTSGSRKDYVFVGEALASRGVVTVVADYRLHPKVDYREILRDCALALEWTGKNIAQYGGDPRRIVLMGHSAGAYNAAMLAYNEAYRNDDVRGFVGLGGPYDFLPLKSGTLREIFGYPNTSPLTQPITFVDENAPPTLLITATKDNSVEPGNSARLANRLRALGREVREIAYPNLSHATLVGTLAKPLRGKAPVLDEVERFIKEHTSVVPLEPRDPRPR